MLYSVHMKVIGVFVMIALLGVAIYFLLSNNAIQIPLNGRPTNNDRVTQPPIDDPNAPRTLVLAEDLDTPWAIAFLPNREMLVAERPGTVKLITPGSFLTIAKLPNVREISEGGLLGMALHPQFASNKYVYFYYTYGARGGNTQNRVVRMKFDNNELLDEEVILDNIPGAPNHNGGRIKFGPDGYLYIATGDAQEPSLAQDRNSLAGKILRVTDSGAPAPGNPFGNRTYSYGHRNPQGISWDENGVLWETEHGPSGIPGGDDEVNKIEVGKNYGWPDITGSATKPGMVSPVATSGKNETWAPGSAAVIGDTLYFGGLRGAALYTYPISGGNVAEHFKNEFGRIREVIVGPDGLLYITTSNQDGRGNPAEHDDKIIRVNPTKL